MHQRSDEYTLNDWRDDQYFEQFKFGLVRTTTEKHFFSYKFLVA